jgi:hypothetical protein
MKRLNISSVLSSAIKALKIRNLAYALVAAFIGLSVVACTAPSKDAPTEEIYNRLMTQLSDDVVETSWGGNKTPEGTIFPYRTQKRAKSLAVCINWDRSNRYNIAFSGWSSNSGYREIGKSKTASMHNCKQAHESNSTCKCQIIDSNDKNVMEVPAEFLAHYSSTMDNEAGVPSNLQKNVSKPDETICWLALARGKEAPAWDERSFSREYVDEAKRRDLTSEQCAEISGQ